MVRVLNSSVLDAEAQSPAFYVNVLRRRGLNIFQNIFDLVRGKYQAQNVSEHRAEKQ